MPSIDFASMTDAKIDMIEEMDAAGYEAVQNDYVCAFEKSDRWLFVAEDEEASFLVGEFFKRGLVSAADFAGEPLVEGLEVDEAVEYAKQAAEQ